MQGVREVASAYANMLSSLQEELDVCSASDEPVDGSDEDEAYGY